MKQIVRYVFPQLEKGVLILPHKKRIIILSNDDESEFKVLTKDVFLDGTEGTYTSGELGESVTSTELRDWLMRTLLGISCRAPHPRLPEITEEDRKWMMFEIN